MLVPRAYARRMRESRLMSRIRECARVREVVNRTLRDGVRACGRVIWAAVLRAARVELWEREEHAGMSLGTCVVATPEAKCRASYGSNKLYQIQSAAYLLPHSVRWCV